MAIISHKEMNKPRTLEDFKAIKSKEIKEHFQSKKDTFMESYNNLEEETFIDQKRDFRAYQLDDTAPTPTIDDIAEGRGVDRLLLIEKIGANVKAEAILVGQQQAKLDEVKACESKECLDNIKF